MTTEPGRYRKKPVIVEALRWTGQNYTAMREFAGTSFGSTRTQDRADDPDLTAEVFGGRHSTWIGVHDGDWIIKGPQGEFYPIRGDVFAETYEPAIPGEDGQP